MAIDKAEQLLSDEGSTQTLATNNSGEGTLDENQRDQFFRETGNPQQHKTRDKGGTTLDCDQGNKFEAQKEIVDEETEQTNQTVEPCEYQQF